MSQAATICKSNFKVSLEAGQAACGRGEGRKEEGVPSWQDQGDGVHLGK